VYCNTLVSAGSIQEDEGSARADFEQEFATVVRIRAVDMLVEPLATRHLKEKQALFGSCIYIVE
jgi:hypothetical protein